MVLLCLVQGGLGGVECWFDRPVVREVAEGGTRGQWDVLVQTTLQHRPVRCETGFCAVTSIAAWLLI